MFVPSANELTLYKKHLSRTIEFAWFDTNCFLSAPVHAFVCDSSGNKTPLRTTLNLSWTPSSCGLLLTKRAQKGEAVFEANTMKCGSRSGDQQVKLKVFSSDHKNLTVSFWRIVYLKRLSTDRNALPAFFLFPFCRWRKRQKNRKDLGHVATSNYLKNSSVCHLL